MAIDCVLCDLLDAEAGIPERSDYQLAADAGLGVFERGDPWGNRYSLIGYVKIEL